MEHQYAQKMIGKGFNFVTVSSDLREMSKGSKKNIEKIKGSTKVVSKSY